MLEQVSEWCVVDVSHRDTTFVVRYELIKCPAKFTWEYEHAMRFLRTVGIGAYKPGSSEYHRLGVPQMLLNYSSELATSIGPRVASDSCTKSCRNGCRFGLIGV